MKYYVNIKAQDNGDHEVHAAGCHHMPSGANRRYLGEFSGCVGAVREGKKLYPQANGCYHCARACHTS